MQPEVRTAQTTRTRSRAQAIHDAGKRGHDKTDEVDVRVDRGKRKDFGGSHVDTQCDADHQIDDGNTQPPQADGRD